MLNDLIAGYAPLMIQSLCELIRIPSVLGPALPQKPFGQACDEALQYTLGLAASLGFSRCESVDGYAGFVEMGQGAQEIGILAHLDVVPAGEGWTVDPFAGIIKEGRIYGRGSMDDKGGVLVALFAMRALLEAKVPLTKRIRLILGLNEETAMQCLDHYLTVHRPPDRALSPDANYPVINTEKGILVVQVTKPVAPTATGLRLLSLSGGERPNVIPGRAVAVLAVPEGLDPQTLLSHIPPLEDRCSLETTLSPGAVTLSLSGQGGHASMPESGCNAASALLDILSNLPLAAGDAEQAVGQFAGLLQRQTNGQALGIAAEDTISGALTLNLGLLSTDAHTFSATFDIRYPVSTSADAILAALKAKFQPLGFTVQGTHDAPPHHVPADDPFVQTLLKVYEQQTGEKGYCIAIGGGTYARKLPGRAVGFGLEFPGDPFLAHTPDEYYEIASFIKSTQIYAHALQALCAK